jgi:signal transduction histidine kinase
MSFSRLVKTTLKKEKSAIILYLCSSFFIILFYYFLYDTNFIAYPILLCVSFLLIYLIYKFFIYKTLYQCLEEGKKSPSYKGAKDNIFEDVFDELKQIHNSYLSRIYDLENKYEEREKLLVEWIHNMKTSVAVIDLAIEKLPSKEALDDIKDENTLLQKNLEGALNIFRLEEFTKDYVPEVINLKSLVKRAINVQKRNFIYANVFPQIDIDDKYYIYTDKKWGEYVIVQLISNAIKYSNSGASVCFYADKSEENINLYIKDSGVGIKKEDMSRIFDAFFTGSNGRNKEKSSGIGLYMCKCICERLNNDINITSEEGKGTEVKISYLAK